MFIFKKIFFLIFAVIVSKIDAKISDKRLCIDEQCTVQVGEGRTLVRYSSPDPKGRLLSFAPNTPLKIFSYGAGSKPEYIGVEISGRRGYVNKHHIRETKTFKKPTLLVPTEVALESIKNSPPEIKADAVVQEYDIIDGTKIPKFSDIESSTPISEHDPTSTEPSVVPDQPDNQKKTEELVVDFKNSDTIVESSQQNVLPEDIPKNMEVPKLSNDSDKLSSEVDTKKPQEELKLFNSTEQIIVKDEPKLPNSADKVDSKEEFKVSNSVEESSNKIDSNEEPKVSDSAEVTVEDIKKRENEENKAKIEDKNTDQEDEEYLEESDEENDDDEEEEEEEQEDQEKQSQEKGFIGKAIDFLGKMTLDEAEPEELVGGRNMDDKKPVETEVDKEFSGDLKIAETLSNNTDESPLSQENGEKNPEKENVEAQQVDKEPVLPDNAVNMDKEENPKPVNENVQEIDNSKPEDSQNVEIEQSEKPYEVPLEKSNELPTTAESTVGLYESNTVTPTPYIFDDESMPFNDVTTSDPLKEFGDNKKAPQEETSANISSDNSTEQKQAEPTVDINNAGLDEKNTVETLKLEEKTAVPTEEDSKPKAEEKIENPILPSDLGGFGGLGLGLFNPSHNADASKEDPVEADNENSSTIETGVHDDSSKEQEDLGSQDFSKSLQHENEESKLPESNLSSRPDLGANEPSFIDVMPSKEPKKVLIEDDIDDNNGTKDYSIPEQDLNISPDVTANLPVDNSGGILSSISSFFGSRGVVSGSEEVKDTTEAAAPSYEEAVKNSDVLEEIVEKPFIKAKAYVTGDNVAVNNDAANENILPKTDDNQIKPTDEQSLVADRPSEFLSYSKQVPSYAEEKFENVWSSGANTEQCFSKDDTSLSLELILQSFSSDMFVYLLTTAISLVIFLFLYMILDKCRREAPLIARINKLEQELLATKKENQLLQEQDSTLVVQQPETVIQGVPNEIVEELTEELTELRAAKADLEEQVAALEKELDNSTEVGIELNRIISDMLSSTDGSEILKENVEQMQKRLLEQQDTINSTNESLNLKQTENHELRLELEIGNKKIGDLQGEVDKMVERIVKIEEERDAQQNSMEKQIEIYRVRLSEASEKGGLLQKEIQVLKGQLTEYQRVAELKIKEFNTLKESLGKLKSANNSKDTIKSLLEVTEIKAQMEQFKSENTRYSEQLRLEQESNTAYAKKIQALSQEIGELRSSYEKADKDKVEVKTKLDVLNNYFREKEEQMQKEISKYESLWAVREGEATSTTERFRLLQEELQNYKAQNESLKQEIMNQEVELKSQISVLERKAHESWVASRQTERKLEEARQEAAQLRNRLTMKERAALEGSKAMRMQSPLLQNGDLPLSPPPLDATLSPPPPLIGNHRDLTMSPPIPGMPPLPFLPPPPGAMPPFMPPPPGGLPHPGMPPFMPPPIFPGDHRPPPLGRMSSPPPLNSRYSPESTIYSEYGYDRNSPSPTYDSEYGASPPARAYSPYEERLRDERLRGDRRDFRRDEDRREYSRPHGRSNGRTSKGLSSGSENELGKINRKSNKKV